MLEKTVANYLTEFLRVMDRVSLKIYTRKFIREKGRKRKRIQALLYGVLTYLYTIDRIAKNIYGDKYEKLSDRKINQIRVYMYRVLFQNVHPPELRKDILLRPITKAKFPETESKVEEISLKTSFPKWIIEKIGENMNLDEIEEYLTALNSRQPTWIVVNTLVNSSERVVRRLEIEGVELEEDRELPNVYKVLSTRKAIDKTEPYRENEILIMNKASAAVVYSLDPKPDEVILDACAAPGMKTLLSAILMENQGKIIAFDVSDSRLNRMKKLLKRYDISIVEVHREDASKIVIDSHVDKVLIDAPCSSSGMIMESPDIKLRLTPKYIEKFSELQKNILFNILAQVERGVKLTYSTCSIFPEEGENQIENLLNEKIGKVEYVKFGSPSYKGREIGSRYYPHKHGTIGMFISNIIKT